MLKRWVALSAALLTSAFVAVNANADGVLYTLCEETPDGTVYEINAFVCGTRLLTAPDVLPINEGDRFYLKETGYECSLRSNSYGRLLVSTGMPLGDTLDVVDLDTGDVLIVTAAGLDAGTITGTVHWRGQACGLLNCPGLSVGDLVCTMQGEACGLVCAEWTDSDGCYVVVPINMMAAEAALKPAGPSWVEPQLTLEKNRLTVSWPNLPDQLSTLFLMQESNYYFNCYQTGAKVDRIETNAVPGQSIAVWVYTGDVDPEVFSTHYPHTVIQVPDADPFTDHHFTNSCTVGTLPAEIAADEADVRLYFPPVFSAESLLSGAEQLVFQVTNTYEVSTRLECSMMFVLTTPDGQVWKEQADYFFEPSLCSNDLWQFVLDPLLETSRRVGNAPASGEFTIAYYLDGLLGGRCSFTVE